MRIFFGGCFQAGIIREDVIAQDIICPDVFDEFIDSQRDAMIQ